MLQVNQDEICIFGNYYCIYYDVEEKKYRQSRTKIPAKIELSKE